MSPKSRLADTLLAGFFGILGAHKFYEGKIGLGILYVFTGGLLGVGALIDFIVIICGKSKDSNGLPITNWKS